MPNLQPNQLYYVRFLNEFDSTRLFNWNTAPIDIYGGGDVNVGDFEIGYDG